MYQDFLLPHFALISIYCSLVRPYLHYGVVIWDKVFKNGPSKICGR